MDKYQETFQTWNTVAKTYEEKFMNLDLYNDSYDIFLDLISKKKANILEVGCGPANITKYLLAKNIDLIIKGIDISENMIDLARKNNPTADFETMDSRDIGSLNKKFDAIICGFCIPYLSENDCEKLISDCKNLLNDSGVLYISFVEGEYKNSDFITGSSGKRVFFYYHNLITIEKTLKSNQFKRNTLISKQYSKADGTEETHLILISKKTNTQ